MCAHVNLLGTTNQRQLGNVLVGDFDGDGLALGAAVSEAHPDSSLHITVRNLDIGGENVLVPVVLYCGCGLSGFRT